MTGQRMSLDYDALFLAVMKELFADEHVIWDHIHIEKTVRCGVCTNPIPVFDALYVEAIHMWACPQACEAKF